MPGLPSVDALRTFGKAILRLVSATPVVVPLAVLPLAASTCYRTWRESGNRRVAQGVVALLLAMGVTDGLLLAALPRLGLSFGPVGLPWLGIILLRAGVAWGAAALGRRYLPTRMGTVAVLLWALNLGLLGGEVHSLYYEPFNLCVTHVQVVGPVAGRGRLRIVQLSDLHTERLTSRERAMLATADGLQPDLIVLTGDYLNLSNVDDPRARQDARELLSQLHARYGVYAVTGTPGPDSDESMAALFGGLDQITVLDDRIARVEAEGQAVYLVGVANQGRARDRAALTDLMGQVPAGSYTILLHHNPDLIATASELGVDLYLAGHTHGGQVRLPGLGAILTSSGYGKRYEAGLYRVGGTQLYVSRGIGLEGLGVPRLRFLCPPEVVELVLDRPG